MDTINMKLSGCYLKQPKFYLQIKSIYMNISQKKKS